MMRVLAPDVEAMPILRRPMEPTPGPRHVQAIILRVGNEGHNAQIVLTRDEVARLAADIVAMIEEPADV